MAQVGEFNEVLGFSTSDTDKVKANVAIDSCCKEWMRRKCLCSEENVGWAYLHYHHVMREDSGGAKTQD